jgi:membrane protein
VRSPKQVLDRVKGWPPIVTTLAVHRRVDELGGGFLASAVTLTIFVSLFPLLLMAIAALGFIAAGDETLATDLIENLGLTGDTADTVTDGLTAAQEGRAGASVVGLLGLVWTTLGVVGAIEHVCDRAWQLPGRGLKGKLVALGWLAGSLVLLGGSLTLSGLLNVLPGWLAPVQVLAGWVLVTGFFLFTFRVLTSRPLPARTHLPGAILGGVGLQILTVVGAIVVPRQAASSSALYGSIGVVFALIAWLLLFGRLLVYSVVLNVVLHERTHGTVRVEVEAPRFDGQVPLAADRSAVIVSR